jgi:hypothetical protein
MAAGNPKAPLAPRRPRSVTRYGVTVTDDYAWLKDARWQEVLRDPSLLEQDIRNYLEAENAHTEALLGHTAALQTKLVAEMRGRIKEDDSSVPSPDGPFEYFQKFREGGQHELIGRARRNGGDTHILIDGDALAARRRAALVGPPAGGLERRHQWIGILFYPDPRLGDVKRYRRHHRADQRRGGLGGGLDRVLLRQARRQPPSHAGLSAPPGHDAIRGPAGL